MSSPRVARSVGPTGGAPAAAASPGGPEERQVPTGAVRSLRGSFLMLVGGIFLVVGAVAVLSFLQVTRALIQRLAADFAVQYASRQKGNILAKLEREVVLARKLADSPVLRQWSLDETNGVLQALALDELESYRRLFLDGSVFFVIDASRHYYFGGGAGEGGIRYEYTIRGGDPTTAWYFAAMEHVDEFALHVDNSPQLGLTKVWINAVVREGGRKVGLGGTGIDLTAFLKETVHVEEPGVETILVDAAGFVQGHSDVALMERNAQIREEEKRLKVFDLLADDGDRALVSDRLARLASGSTQIESFELGTGAGRRLVAAAYMEGIDWAAIVLVNPSDVVRFRRFLPILGLLAAAWLATILLVSWGLDRLVLRRLARLTASTRELAAGHYGVVLPVDRPDEIGHLTVSFNEMAATIHSYTQDLELKVEERTCELRSAHDQLDASNRKVMDSIRYARLIQGSLLPSAAEIDAALPEWGIVWRPRDLVGGDFYALYPDGGGGCLVAVADCTGHGVPGAFMAMAAKALLDRAVADEGGADPAALLATLDLSVRSLLSREGAGGRNGLDIALASISPGRRSMTFAAARLPLWIQDATGAFTVVAGDRHSLGYSDSAPAVAFTNHVVAVRPGDRFFLLTDGILDQAFGPKRFGLGQRRLREALVAWRSEPLSRIEPLLVELLQRPEATAFQRDDITLVAFGLDHGPGAKEIA